MPVLPIYESHAPLWSLNRLRVFSVMYFPDDTERRGQFVHTTAIHTDLNVLQKRKKLDIERDSLEALLQSPSIDSIKDEIIKNVIPRAYQAGLLVFYLFVLKQLGKTPSMNRALRLVESRYDKTVATSKGFRPIPHSEESIRRAWRVYRPVSHLWATHIAFNEKEPVESWIDFNLFLARSELFAEFCMGIISEKINKPLFPKGEMWRVPELYSLPIVEPLDFIIDHDLQAEADSYSVS